MLLRLSWVPSLVDVSSIVSSHNTFRMEPATQMVHTEVARLLALQPAAILLMDNLTSTHSTVTRSTMSGGIWESFVSLGYQTLLLLY